METIIISGVNLTNGGPFTILHDCLEYITSSQFALKYKVIVLINNKKLFQCDTVQFIEFPRAKKHWINRIYYEYIYFRKLARMYKPHLWLSLHDITPTVKDVDILATYMHNPSLFDKLSIKKIRYYKFSYVLFALFYKWLYRINIHKNNYVIVQQQWLREAFAKMFSLKTKKIIVAKPIRQIGKYISQNNILPEHCYTFLYPSYPRPFKNFEIICAAAESLEKEGIRNFRIKLTIDGNESKYTRWIYRQYKYLKTIEFVGLMKPQEMSEIYAKTDCLIFPSRLETWGLPISEFMSFHKPMILADMPYAHETAEGAQYVAWFQPDDAKTLAQLIKMAIQGDYIQFRQVPQQKQIEPYSPDWEHLFKILLQ